MMRRILSLSILIVLIGLVMPIRASKNQPATLPSDQLANNVENLISVPAGFEITVFADNVPNARSLEYAPDGTLFVGSRQAGIVYALRDDDNNGVADGVLQIASGLWSPNGVAYHEGDLYVSSVNRILRFDDISANLTTPPQPVVVTASYPDTAHHGWKFIRFGPDGMLYVPQGAPCNVCASQDARFATITRINPDGTGFEIYAQGVRNSVGFDWHPETGELWFTDNGRDSMGDDIPPDELNRAPVAGLHFGFPYCHGEDILDPGFVGFTCDDFNQPAINLGPHVAALGMRFYTGESFPEEYQNQIFIAEHGSWDRSIPIGYRIMLVRLDDDGNAASYEPFAEGWLLPNNTFWGRPVDIEHMPDGSLLISDDHAGAIYRIAYVGEE